MNHEAENSIMGVFHEKNIFAFEKSIGDFFDAKNFSSLENHLIDILLYFKIHRALPSRQFSTLFLAWLYRYQESLVLGRALEELLFQLLIDLLKCDPSGLALTEAVEPLGQSAQIGYVVSRYIAAGKSPPVVADLKSYSTFAHDTCMSLYKCEYVSAYQSLLGLKWVEQQIASGMRFSEKNVILLFIEQATRSLTAFETILQTSRLNWEGMIFRSVSP